MRVVLTRVLFTVAAVAAAAPALAQPATDAAAKKTQTAPANLASGAVTGTPAVQVILDASKKEKKGIVSIGWRNGQGQTQLTLSGPLDDEENAEPVSLLGLPNGASATLSFTRRFWQGPTPLEQQQILDLCRRARLSIDTKDPRRTCELRNFTDPLQAGIFRQLQHLDDRPWLLSGSATGSRVNQKFVETVVSAPGSESRTVWSLTGLAGMYTPSFGFTFLSATYKEAFKAAAPASQICRPVPETDALRCANVIVGRPSYSNATIVALETRKFIAGKAAIAPSLQFDVKNDIRAIEVPIYFLGSGASPIGGVRFGWRSDTKEVTAVVFVGAAFSLLPG